MLVEAERLRPHLEELLMLADYVVTSKHFPQVTQHVPLGGVGGLCASRRRTPLARPGGDEHLPPADGATLHSSANP